jgi:hypothetical protein
MYLSKNVINLKSGNYTFSDYFKMNINPKNLAKVFGYRFEIDTVSFKQNELSNELNYFIQDFHKNLYKIQKRINLNSEMAKREFLIAPIIYELVKNINISVDIEANTYFDNTLKGSIDYVLNNENNIFIAIEAKNSEIEKGILQLIAELIAIDKIVEEESDFIYGAVTIGFTWSFVVLDRKEKLITKHIDYLSIKELDEIIKILVGILDS